MMKEYLKNKKMEHIKVIIIQILLLVSFLGLWEVTSRLELIDSFLFSKPSNVFKILIDFIKKNRFTKNLNLSNNQTKKQKENEI